MRYIFLFCLIFIFQKTILGQCQDFSVQVKDTYGYPLRNASVNIEYSSSGSSETKTTNNNGIAVFKCRYTNAKPYVKVSVSAKGYSSISRNDTWNGNLDRSISLKEDKEYASVRGEISGKKTLVKNTIVEVQQEIDKKRADQDASPQDIADLEKIKSDLEAKQQEYEELLKESSSHEQAAADYKALYEEKSRDYDDLKFKFNEIKDKLGDTEDAISIELFDCKCEGWNSDYIQLSFRAKDGRSGLILTSTKELAVDISKKGKNENLGEYLLFNEVEDKTKYSFLFRPNEEGYSTVIIRPIGDAFEGEYKKIGDNPYNYTITFYNKDLFKYRDKFKISLGSYLITDLAEVCGKKKKLLPVP